jgi:hypothetical protein
LRVSNEVASAAGIRNAHDGVKSITPYAKKPGALRTRILNTSEIARKGRAYVSTKYFFSARIEIDS